jgi:hypothetical protein
VMMVAVVVGEVMMVAVVMMGEVVAAMMAAPVVAAVPTVPAVPAACEQDVGGAVKAKRGDGCVSCAAEPHDVGVGPRCAARDEQHPGSRHCCQPCSNHGHALLLKWNVVHLSSVLFRDGVFRWHAISPYCKHAAGGV